MKNYEEELCNYLNQNWMNAKINCCNFLKIIHASKYICLFGAGQVGMAVANLLNEFEIRVDYFCDNNEKLWGKEICLGIQCVSIEEIEKYKKDVCILLTTAYHQEIYIQLKKLGFNNIYLIPEIMLKNNYYWNEVDLTHLKENICGLIRILDDTRSKEIASEIVKNWFRSFSQYPYNYSELSTENQYFTKELLKLSNDEIFVDVGSFDGDTIEKFLFNVENKFEQIIAYELDKECYKKLEKNISNNMNYEIRNKITLHNLGLFDKNEKIRYSSNSANSTIQTNANVEGEVVRLSDHLKNQKVTFIKMDIEGAEMNALYGAEEIIKSQKPKLAICVYHEPKHLWEIPLYLKKLVPEYRIFIRHHTNLEYETVCYAII